MTKGLLKGAYEAGRTPSREVTIALSRLLLPLAIVSGPCADTAIRSDRPSRLSRLLDSGLSVLAGHNRSGPNLTLAAIVLDGTGCRPGRNAPVSWHRSLIDSQDKEYEDDQPHSLFCSTASSGSDVQTKRSPQPTPAEG
jgi:hypothetical protein